MKPKLIHQLALTHTEAWAVLRSIALANMHPDQTPMDKAASTWAAERLLKIVDEKSGS